MDPYATMGELEWDSIGERLMEETLTLGRRTA